MSAEDEGRTETATEKQREKFRKKGSVAKSAELNSLAAFLAGYIALSFLGGYILIELMAIFTYTFEELYKHSLTSTIDGVSALVIERIAVLLLPFLLILMVFVFVTNVMQFGFKITWEAVKPKWNKLNAFANLKNVLFSAQSMMELLKSCLKISILSYLVFIAILPLTEEFMSLNQLTPVQIGLITWEYARSIWFMIILFMLFLGIADYSWQKYQLEQKMKMKKQDVDDEQKQMMGDPMVKAKQRQKGMQMLQQIMSEQTKDADVVITNPTHFAVALKYSHGQMGAPKVVAKGIDHLALKLRKIARTNSVPIVENRGLARSLYYSTDVGTEIPEELFRPVAEILAFVFKLNKEAGNG